MTAMPTARGKYYRFDRAQRIEHALLIASFTVLGLTGLPQMYPDSWLGNLMIETMGGIESTRIIHRISAVLLIVLAIYHLASVAYKVFVRRVDLTMMPGWKDVKDAYQKLAHNLGRATESPQMGRYTFAEKLEYWAVVWGTLIMILTGFMLWNPIATTQLLPGQFVPVAKAAHGGEALLAVLAIVTWHLYHVHIKSFNRSIFTGYLDRPTMEEEHGLELARIESRQLPAAPPSSVLKRRQRVFIPIAAAASLLLLLGLVWFITFEETAITTVPRQPVEAFVPAGSSGQPSP